MKSILFWFRRDLRLHDNAGLCQALKSADKVHCVFVFDRDILDALPSKSDRRVEFIWESVAELKTALQQCGADLIVQHAHADQAIPALASQLNVDAVFANGDYEPAAIDRDRRVAAVLQAQDMGFQTFKDTVIFEKDEVLTQAGKPFGVFTAYKNAWLKKLSAFDLQPHAFEPRTSRLAGAAAGSTMPTLESMGFARTNILSLLPCGASGAEKLRDEFTARMADYQLTRDFPAVKGVSYLSVHNRFGTISIRELATIAHAESLRPGGSGAQAWLSELIWRDFYFQILFHHPRVVTHTFKAEYDALPWENNPAWFRAWCAARTGYPIIDAAMRQLNQTGYMHNRLRMIVASFLTKDLLVDWRWGEKYFADNLNDFDLSANNGGWQWAASTGCDAQPYFRIFNPVTQSERFDPQGKFIRKYLPELNNVPDKFIHAPWTMPPLESQAIGFVVGHDYPAPIVDHAVQRIKVLAMFKAVRG